MASSRSTLFKFLTLGNALGFLAFLFLNRHTGLGFFDASEYALHIRAGGIAHAPGYPLYVLLGQALHALGADPFLAQHLISLASLAFAAWALYSTLSRRFPLDPWTEPAASITVLLLFSSHYLKKYTVLPEVFVLNIALFAGLGWALDRWWVEPTVRRLSVVALCYGLGFAHHHTLALTLPATLLLLWMKRDRLSAPQGVWALGGFWLGAAPILYLCVPIHSTDTLNTYFFVQNIRDLLFVVLRKGYGTFSLSVLKEQSSLSELFTVIARAVAKNFNFVALAVFMPLISTRVRARAFKEDPLLVYSGLTLLMFFAFFLPRGNLPLGTETYKNTLLRFATVPSFLLLYPAFHGIRRALPRLASALKSPDRAIAAMIIFILASNFVGCEELKFRHYDFLDEHIRQGYEAIFSEDRPDPSGIASDWHKCAIFVRADTLVFSLRYFNQFSATRRCFIFTPVSFSGQFRARYEEELQRRAFGNDYAAALLMFKDNPFGLMQFFFTRLKDMGYKLYLFYQPDFVAFHNSPFGYRPVGNILELVTEKDASFSPDRFHQLRSAYLKNLDAYLTRVQPTDIPASVIDETVTTGLTQNLIEYGRFTGPGPHADSALEAKVNARFSELYRRFPDHPFP